MVFGIPCNFVGTLDLLFDFHFSRFFFFCFCFFLPLKKSVSSIPPGHMILGTPNKLICAFCSFLSFFRKCDCKLTPEQNKYFITFIWINVPLILLSQSPLIDYSLKYSNQKEKVGENSNISLNEGNSSNYDNVLLTTE